jgi:hypothetical protein
MLQHLAHHAFANCNIPREADYVFIRPTTHGSTSKINKAAAVIIAGLHPLEVL